MKSQDEPKRLSHEWHALECDEYAEARDRSAEGRTDVIGMIRQRAAEEHRDRAAKLRQAAVDAARVEDLRDALDFATSGLTLILADVRLGITVDADILDLRMECQKALKENADE